MIMNEDKMEDTIQPYKPAQLMPIMDIESAIERRNFLANFVHSNVMIDGTDYGTCPGISKPFLRKAGAEKLGNFFGLSTRLECVDKVEDWTGENHNGEPLFYYRISCQVWHGDLLVTQAEGSCNSWEKKYRYRQASRLCPRCERDTIIKGKVEYGGGWLCFDKKGGCGFKWPDGAIEIEGQQVGVVKNDNPADLANTILKMAEKRAFVAGIIIAVNASEFFTQDIEDFAEGQFEVSKDQTRRTETRQSKPRPTQKPVITLEQAKSRKTKKGKVYETLNYEQLEMLSKVKNETTSECAKLLMNEMDKLFDKYPDAAASLTFIELEKLDVGNLDDVKEDDIPPTAEDL